MRGSEPVCSAVLPQFSHTAAELLDGGPRPDSI
jgi:hypothetical protein